jgi:phosphopantothenoylcysteine decarboxylase/phosphopantothenate--cysteine ligase
MVEPEIVIGQARYLLTRTGPLRGKHVVVTAAGTQEPIDPVRVVANRSSGKQGFALAQAALDLGAEVTLVCGPTALPTPVGARRVDVRTAAEMQEAVFRHLDEADILLMAAAVADYRPEAPAEHKIKKGRDRWELRLTRTTDILATLAAQRASFPRLQLVVGFAAESRDLLENARHKLEAKRLDLIVANDITAPQAGFAVDTNRVTLLYADGWREALPLMSKAEVAHAVLLRALVLLEGGLLGHLAPRRAWEHAQPTGMYAPPSLEANGFVHLSRLDQIPRVYAHLYAGREDLVLLKIRFAAVAEHLRWEAADGETFPHLYAPLPVEAVAAVEPVPSGGFDNFAFFT